MLAAKPWRVDAYFLIVGTWSGSVFFRTKREAAEYVRRRHRDKNPLTLPRKPFVDHKTGLEEERKSLRRMVNRIEREKWANSS